MSLDFCLGYKNDGHFNEVFIINITHNLNVMAEKVGIYKALWCPDENGFVAARDIVAIISLGLQKLKDNPVECKKCNPDNGWGNYEGLINFVEKILIACIKYPNALIGVSR